MCSSFDWFPWQVKVFPMGMVCVESFQKNSTMRWTPRFDHLRSCIIEPLDFHTNKKIIAVEQWIWSFPQFSLMSSLKVVHQNNDSMTCHLANFASTHSATKQIQIQWIWMCDFLRVRCVWNKFFGGWVLIMTGCFWKSCFPREDRSQPCFFKALLGCNWWWFRNVSMISERMYDNL